MFLSFCKLNFLAPVLQRTIPTSDRRLAANLVPIFADKGCVAQSARRIPYGRNIEFLDRRRYFFFQVAPQLYSRG
jgi:hypothetical protein